MYEIKDTADMKQGDTVEGFFQLGRAQVKKSSNGKMFLAGTLIDGSGSIDFKKWDYTGDIGSGENGKVVKVRGEVSEYNGASQLIVSKIRYADENDDYDMDKLSPSAPVDVDAEAKYLTDMAASLEDDDYRLICTEMLKRHMETLRRYPAAKSVHHEFRGGLIMHTASMVRLADALYGFYPDLLDRSLLIAGTMLHDMEKDREFELSEIGVVTSYSVRGQLIGHLVMGAEEIKEIADGAGVPEEKSILLQHMVLSHHGEPEFGAAVRPMCAEAEMLSYIDLIDSRMQIYTEVFASLAPGEFSSRIFALDKKIYKHK